jgi:hypothetical protein
MDMVPLINPTNTVEDCNQYPCKIWRCEYNSEVTWDCETNAWGPVTTTPTCVPEDECETSYDWTQVGDSKTFIKRTCSQTTCFGNNDCTFVEPAPPFQAFYLCPKCVYTYEVTWQCGSPGSWSSVTTVKTCAGTCAGQDWTRVGSSLVWRKITCTQNPCANVAQCGLLGSAQPFFTGSYACGGSSSGGMGSSSGGFGGSSGGFRSMPQEGEYFTKAVIPEPGFFEEFEEVVEVPPAPVKAPEPVKAKAKGCGCGGGTKLDRIRERQAKLGR